MPGAGGSAAARSGGAPGGNTWEPAQAASGSPRSRAGRQQVSVTQQAKADTGPAAVPARERQT